MPLSRYMFATAVSLTHNAKAAEDLVQDAFERLWIHRDELDTVESMSSYVNAIVRHLFVDRLRRKRMSLVDLPQEMQFADNNPTPERLTEIDEYTKNVYRLIELLPQQQRAIITLRDIEGRKYEEIEKITGLSNTSIRVALSRARKIIRKQFNEFYGDER